jgi:NAD(P)-dependent dehydrogenase (short-subunit alcohol dehydrogenase family)
MYTELLIMQIGREGSLNWWHQWIGGTTIKLFVQHGAKVIITDVQDDLGHSVCCDISTNDDTISYVHCDVTSESDVQNAVNTVVSKHATLMRAS